MFLQPVQHAVHRKVLRFYCMTDLCCAVATNEQHTEAIVWSNYLVNSPAVYSLIEKRVLYYLTLQIKHRFVERGLDAPGAWKDLYFYLTDKDLGEIGGKTHVLQTYEALSEIGSKFMTVSYYNRKKELIRGKVHWIDSFAYNTVTQQYEVRMSPELMPYLINLAKGFTTFCAQTALALRSKYSQKFYEFCCEYSGNFRYPRANSGDFAFRKNVYPIQVESLRYLLGLADQKDARTGKITTKGKYKNFCDLRKNVIRPAQQELYELFHQGKSEVWFDCVPFQRQGRKIVSVLLVIYTKERPKQGLQKIWEESDEPLNPFEAFTQAALLAKKTSPTVERNDSIEVLLGKIQTKLNTYLEHQEVLYYLDFIQSSQYFGYDSCAQVLQVIEEKERQPKFQSGTRAYQRKSIMHYALVENLNKNFNWSIPTPKVSRSA